MKAPISSSNSATRKIQTLQESSISNLGHFSWLISTEGSADTPGPGALVVDFDGQGGPGQLPVSIQRVDANIGFDAFIDLGAEDNAILDDEVPTFSVINTVVPIIKPTTTLTFEYLFTDPSPPNGPSQITVLIRFSDFVLRGERDIQFFANLDDINSTILCVEFAEQ